LSLDRPPHNPEAARSTELRRTIALMALNGGIQRHRRVRTRIYCRAAMYLSIYCTVRAYSRASELLRHGVVVLANARRSSQTRRTVCVQYVRSMLSTVTFRSAEKGALYCDECYSIYPRCSQEPFIKLDILPFSRSGPIRYHDTLYWPPLRARTQSNQEPRGCSFPNS